MGAGIRERGTMYQAEISRNHPTLFVFLIDQSGSMAEPIAGQALRKCDFVADAMNKLIAELAVRCAREDGVRDYFHVALIGYGATVQPALGGQYEGRAQVPISELANSPTRVEDRMKSMADGAGGVVERPIKFPVWFDAQADGATPMCGALGEAERLVRDWVQKHRDGFPPTVINITDGVATDGHPLGPADNIRRHETADGATLMFNLHVSAMGGQPVLYPANAAQIQDEFAQLLFAMSSQLPDSYAQFARDSGMAVDPGARGLVFNGGMESVVNFLEIGTRVAG